MQFAIGTPHREETDAFAAIELRAPGGYCAVVGDPIGAGNARLSIECTS